MSRADDESLQAMALARMSPASIAGVLGWSEARVARRLGELASAQAQAEDAATPPPDGAADSESNSQPDAARAAAKAPDPLPEGVGLVTRSFHLTAGGFGAAVLLGDNRIVFAETGRDRAEPAKRIQVAPAAGVYRGVVERKAAVHG